MAVWRWLIFRPRLAQGGRSVVFVGLPADKVDLFDAVRARADHTPPQTRRFGLDDLVAMVGRGVMALWSDLLGVIGMLGLVLTSIARTLVRPTRWRFNAFVTQLDKSALRAVPIIVLIQFVIGGIIAQQGVYQLRLFGAEVFAIDLVAILVLREIGVLISAIMVAGRSGSAFTAEIGAMRMREEVDAMRVIGLNPVDVLVIPAGHGAGVRAAAAHRHCQCRRPGGRHAGHLGGIRASIRLCSSTGCTMRSCWKRSWSALSRRLSWRWR